LGGTGLVQCGREQKKETSEERGHETYMVKKKKKWSHSQFGGTGLVECGREKKKKDKQRKGETYSVKKKGSVVNPAAVASIGQQQQWLSRKASS